MENDRVGWTPFDEARCRLSEDLSPIISVDRRMLERLTDNPPEGSRSRSIAFLERILTDLRENKTLAYLVVRMDLETEQGSGTYGFDGKLPKRDLSKFEEACIYFTSVVIAKIKGIKKKS